MNRKVSLNIDRERERVPKSVVPIQRGHTWEYKAGLAERGWEDVMEIIRMFTWPN